MLIILQALFVIIRIGANFVLAPVNLIVSTMFPDFSSLVNTFHSFLTTYITPGLLYFFNFLPPTTRNLILLYMSLRIIIYLGSIYVHGIIKVFEIIKAIKIW